MGKIDQIEYLNKYGYILDDYLMKNANLILEKIAKAVIKIENDKSIHPFGTDKATCFLICDSPPKILTAWHVFPLKKYNIDKIALLVENSKFLFRNKSNESPQVLKFNLINGCYCFDYLDFVIIRIVRKSELDGIGMYKNFTEFKSLKINWEGLTDDEKKIIVIHYPENEPKRLAISKNNYQIFIPSNKEFEKDKEKLPQVIYKMVKCGFLIPYYCIFKGEICKSTAGGSSGAPIFDESLNLIGIHIAGFSFYSFALPVSLILSTIL